MIEIMKRFMQNIIAILLFLFFAFLFYIAFEKTAPKLYKEVLVDEIKIEIVEDNKAVEDIEIIEFVEDNKKHLSEYEKLLEFLDNDMNEATYLQYEEELPKNIIIDEVIIKQPKIKKIKKKISKIEKKSDKKPIDFEKPQIAIVIDDMGINKKRTHDINQLKFPITSSYLTYIENMEEQITQSINAGHEIIAHIPMEAYSPNNAAPDVLKVKMTGAEVKENFSKMLEKFKNINGINNHMGSKFTESKPHMVEIIKLLKEKKMFFFDSVTSSKSVGVKVAKEYNTSYLQRNIFLDNENDLKYILNQLKATEKIAKKQGYAIAIGHPKSQTYEALKIWLPEIEKKGFKLVLISNLAEALN